ncbi:hypothetical protein [Loktanella sp. M215]|uniref:hypothetical protein n=1 Tax=Loktanella sp. M215 TaxID=2675431 RepID=UPI001F1E125F|nr:hypothetical protein [Loktanella sp. M215]MCF7701595.1 hypothetical protein [Loktanella sp. M215]
MVTVTRRTVRSSPYRDSLATWSAIADLLTRSNSNARSEIDSVAGIASSIITDRACQQSAIIVSCSGPQTRIYCIYDDDAIDGSDANEDILGFNPLNGDWSISLPCDAEDLDWVQSALKQKSERITARDKSEAKKEDVATSGNAAVLQIDIEGLQKL